MVICFKTPAKLQRKNRIAKQRLQNNTKTFMFFSFSANSVPPFATLLPCSCTTLTSSHRSTSHVGMGLYSTSRCSQINTSDKEAAWHLAGTWPAPTASGFPNYRYLSYVTKTMRLATSALASHRESACIVCRAMDS